MSLKGTVGTTPEWSHLPCFSIWAEEEAQPRLGAPDGLQWGGGGGRKPAEGSPIPDGSAMGAMRRSQTHGGSRRRGHGHERGGTANARDRRL